MRPIIFIMGEPNSGKTALARLLAPGECRIHLDNVCLILAIKRPDLMPPELPADDLPDIDLTVDFTGKIHRFCAHLAKLQQSHLLLEEYLGVLAARQRSTQVVEGYALGAMIPEMEAAHRAMGREVIKVWREREQVVVDHHPLAFDEALVLLKRHLHPLKYP